MYGMREMTDNDILCDPEKMDDIKLIMEELGYECASFGECNHDIYSKPPCLEFEMHRSLFLRTEMPLCADYFDDVKNKLIAAGKYEYRFTDEDFYIYILAHEYKHFSHRGTGMRSLMDVYVFLNAHPNLEKTQPQFGAKGIQKRSSQRGRNRAVDDVYGFVGLRYGPPDKGADYTPKRTCPRHKKSGKIQIPKAQILKNAGSRVIFREPALSL